MVNGPGDKAFPAVIRALSEDQPIDEIENLIFIREGKIIKTKKASLYNQDELKSLPYQQACLILSDGRILGQNIPGIKNNRVPLQYRLSFYLFVLRRSSDLSRLGGKGKSAPLIYKDLKFLKEKYGGNAFQFHDNNFFVSEKRAVEFANLITPEKMKWWAEGRIDTMDQFSDESLQAVADSGMHDDIFWSRKRQQQTPYPNGQRRETDRRENKSVRFAD